MLKFLAHLLPAKMRHQHHRLVASGMMVFARKCERRPQPVLSVIVPAYNEIKTFTTLMESLLHKDLSGLEMEVIIVESNSSDGTREAALKYRDHALESNWCSTPGKGHAVRSGLGGRGHRRLRCSSKTPTGIRWRGLRRLAGTVDDRTGSAVVLGSATAGGIA